MKRRVISESKIAAEPMDDVFQNAINLSLRDTTPNRQWQNSH
jgi:hypothetical protein